MIRTRKNLERQQTFSYNLTIGASDQGKPSRVSMVKTHQCKILHVWVTFSNWFINKIIKKLSSSDNITGLFCQMSGDQKLKELNNGHSA